MAAPPWPYLGTRSQPASGYAGEGERRADGAQAGIDVDTVAQDSFGCMWLCIQRPVPAQLGPAEKDPVAVREQVGQFRGVVAGRDEEFADTGVGRDDNLAADGGGRRVGHEVVRADPGAVH